MRGWAEAHPGLVYKDLRLSDGQVVATGDVVQVHYQIALGEEREGDPAWIDDSWERGQPFRLCIGAGEVLKGVDQAMVGMRVAGTRRMVLSPEWAYGDRALAELVPSGSVLTVQVYVIMKEESADTGGVE